MSQVKKEFEKFAKPMGKHDSEEMLMYYRAGWVKALDYAIEMLRNSSIPEVFKHLDDTK